MNVEIIGTRNQRSQRCVLVAAWFGFFLLATTAVAQQGSGSLPAYRSFRYDEDWSFLADRSRRTDWLDALKYIPLGPTGWFATVGGEARERFELLDQPGFGTGPEDRNGYLLQRYLLSSDFHFGPHIRLFGELQSGLENGRNGGPRPTDLDRLDLHQAFLDWKFVAAGDITVTIRAGRQELGFGSGRLISPAEGLNLRRSLDGVRAIIQRGRLVWNASALRLVRANQGIFDDTPDHAQTYWGAGVVAPHPFWKGANIALHYHGLDRKNSVFEKGAGRAIRHTIGIRTWKNAGSWDANYEALAQWGSFRGAPIRAWALSQDTGYTWNRGRFHPRLGLRSDIASGDHGRSSRALGSFDPLFPAAPVYSGPSGLLAPTNLIDFTPSLRMPLRRNVSLALESSSFWRESLGDGIYSPAITPIRGGESNPKRYVATAPSASIAWQVDRHISCSWIFTHFFTGGFFEDARPRRDVNYVAAWISYRF